MLGSSGQANSFSPTLRDLKKKKIKTKQHSISFWGSLCPECYCMLLSKGLFYCKVRLTQPHLRHFR